MTERPMLFSAPMVCALLAGSKTQTRRALKARALEGVSDPAGFVPQFVADAENRMCPYGKPGNNLWVREAWAAWAPHPDNDDTDSVIYRATDGRVPERWKPSIHMPRWASRITLEITGVRVERLKDITEADAVAEGIERRASGFAWYTGRDAKTSYTTNPITSYSSLWESINGAGSWDANPWVWVVEFRRVKP